MQSSRILDNGLLVVSDAIQHVETVSIGVLAKVGSRFESEKENGVSHFLEHMAFKGTPSRSALQIAEEFENIGALFNAYTTKDHTMYYAKVLSENVPEALEILSDIVQNSMFAEEELQKERGVILQEIAQTNDTPDDIIFDHFYSTAYAAQPIGRPILGPRENVSSFRSDDIKRYVAKHYLSNNMIVSCAGKVSTIEFEEMVSDKFQTLKKADIPSADPGRYIGGEFLESRDLDQVNIIMGWEGFPHNADKKMHYSQQILSMILGGGMSSRLFQEVREKRGLAYTVSSFISQYRDTGLLSIFSSSTENNINELLEVICAEVVRLIKDGISQEEITRAKQQLKASLFMSQESTIARMEKGAFNHSIYGRYIPYQEIVRDLETISEFDIMRTAQAIFNTNLTFTSLGKVNSIHSYSALKDMLSI